MEQIIEFIYQFSCHLLFYDSFEEVYNYVKFIYITRYY